MATMSLQMKEDFDVDALDFEQEDSLIEFLVKKLGFALQIDYTLPTSLQKSGDGVNLCDEVYSKTKIKVAFKKCLIKLG